MPTFLTTRKMKSELRARIERSVIRTSQKNAMTRSSRLLFLTRVGIVASIAVIVGVMLITR
ncbi:MAG TPA: hypothetical protein VF407_02515 [Polyangiaceae bacterium]